MLLFIAFLPLVAGWGSLGHRTVAYLAEMHLSPAAKAMTKDLLNGQDISQAALFPDRVVHMPQFHYTAGWHYIDAQDDPPRQCGINITRDCTGSEGCVVSAIANHTDRMLDPSLSHYFRGQSLRFVLHFFGDIHQPLHTENLSRGGNEISVVFDGKHTNIHSVWDSLMPNRYAAEPGHGNEMTAALVWARRLYHTRQATGSTRVAHECTHDATECALEWASEANQLVCTYVLKGYPDVFDHDLAHNGYYDGATEIIDHQIIKAGRRLGAWLNAMADPKRLVLQG